MDSSISEFVFSSCARMTAIDARFLFLLAGTATDLFWFLISPVVLPVKPSRQLTSSCWGGIG